MDTPQIDVVRGLPGLELRAVGDGAMPTLAGHFSRFNEWYEIHSFFEGSFLERFAPGAFADTFRAHWDDSDPHRIKVQFQHGYDSAVGMRLLGKLEELREDGEGGYYEAPLFDTQYNRELIPGLDAGEYGASFRFRVISEEWNEEPGISEANPKGLPERTITGARVFEVGPVAFGASPTATAGLRSLTDDYYEQVRNTEPRVFEEACRAAGRTPPGEQETPPRRRNSGTGRRAKRTELKALPDAVLTRDRGLDLESITTRRRGQELIEARRTSPNLASSQDENGQVVVEGYVVTYDEPRTVAGDAGWTEVWHPGACAASVGRNPDVRLTLNGEGEPIARSKAGTLELSSDDYGVKVRATIDAATPHGEEVALAVQRNEQVDVVVGFDVIRQRWDAGHSDRLVQDANLRDMAFCIDGWDSRSGEDLSRLHTDPDPDPTEDSGMSLDLMRMINEL